MKRHRVRRKPDNAPIVALVVEIIEDGDHGPYVVTKCDERPDLGSITFSLNRKVWPYKARPEVDDRVELRDVRKRSAGWRSHNVRFLRPT